MRFMVVETFKQGPEPVYARAAEQGRLLPTGLEYVESWVEEPGLGRCFQLMECESHELLDRWTSEWSDLVEFEVVPVIGSEEAAARLAR